MDLNQYIYSVMKYGFTLFLFCARIISIHAQSVETFNPTVAKNKVHFGISASVDYNNRFLSTADTSEIYELIIRTRKHSEMWKPGYTIGAKVIFPVNQGLNIQTGLLLAQRGYRTPFRESRWPSEEVNGEYVPNDSLDSWTRLIFRTYTIDVPIIFQFNTNAENQKWFFAAGFSANIYFKETITFVEREDGSTTRETNKRTHDYNPFNLSPEISFERNFTSFNGTKVQIVPTARCNLFPMTNAPVRERLWSAGVNVLVFVN